MFNTRNVVLGVIATFAISIVWGIWLLFQPPDSGGLGVDSYGTRRHGLRALLEILTELGVPVERGFAPPPGSAGPTSTIVLWKPGKTLVGQEPTYLHTVSDWVRAGGRVVVSPVHALDSKRMLFDSRRDTPTESLFEALRCPEIEMDLVDLNAPIPAPAQSESDSEKERRDFDREMNDLKDVIAGRTFITKTQSVTVRGSGSLEGLGRVVKSLELPEADLQVLKLKDAKPDGQITFQDSEGHEQTLVAAFQLGKGQLILVGSASVAENGLIAQRDNSVLIAQLIAPDGQRVVIDEFYHGLTVRGNPLWLFTRPGYLLVMVCLLLAAGLIIWREAIFLGPPLEPRFPTRRSIREYVVAMARFLNRGRATRPFVMKEVRNGVLHAVRQELGLPPGREEPDELAAVLARRDPQRAAKLVDAVRQIDHALSTTGTLPESETIRLLQGISSCL